jgi:hypothetical protein
MTALAHAAARGVAAPVTGVQRHILFNRASVAGCAGSAADNRRHGRTAGACCRPLPLLPV